MKWVVLIGCCVLVSMLLALSCTSAGFQTQAIPLGLGEVSITGETFTTGRIQAYVYVPAVRETPLQLEAFGTPPGTGDTPGVGVNVSVVNPALPAVSLPDIRTDVNGYCFWDGVEPGGEGWVCDFTDPQGRFADLRVVGSSVEVDLTGFAILRLDLSEKADYLPWSSLISSITGVSLRATLTNSGTGDVTIRVYSSSRGDLNRTTVANDPLAHRQLERTLSPGPPVSLDQVQPLDEAALIEALDPRSDNRLFFLYVVVDPLGQPIVVSDFGFGIEAQVFGVPR